MIKKLLRCRKPGVFIPPTSAVHLRFCPFVWTLYRHFRGPILVFSCSVVEESFTSRKFSPSRNRHVSPGTPKVLEGFGNAPPSEPRLGNPGPEVFGNPDPLLQVLRYPPGEPLRGAASSEGIF